MGTVGFREPIPPMVSAWTQGWGFMNEGISSAPPSSSTSLNENQGIWHPIHVPTACIATRMWWANGATVSGTYNIEAGLYYDGGRKPGGKRITTGSVAQGTASEVQFADITDTRLDVGLWWLFISCSSNLATFQRSITALPYDELTAFEQASIGPGSAPDPATPVERTNNQIIVFGFSTNTVT